MAQNPLARRFARELRASRIAAGWSAKELADRCAAADCPRVNRDVIASIETGRRQDVTLDEAACLAHVLATAPTGSAVTAPNRLLVAMLAACVSVDPASESEPGPEWLNRPSIWLAEPPPADVAELASELRALNHQFQRFARKALSGSWADAPKGLTWADAAAANLSYSDLADPDLGD